MITRRNFVKSFAGFVLCTACGKSSNSTGPSGTTSFIKRNGGVHITKGGVTLGTLYLIGSCTGADDDDNVVSLQEKMKDGARGCAGSDYVLEIEKIQENAARVYVEIELATNYKLLSLPFDSPGKAVFNRFAFSNSGYEVGCGNSWSSRGGSGDYFTSIPQPCFIPGAGPVGAARSRGRISWGEISGPAATLRRTPLGGNYSRLFFYNHPHTNNIEIGFPENLRAGAVIAYSEEIMVQ